VLAVFAADAGEPLGEIPAAHELSDDLRNDRAQEPVFALVDLGVDGLERLKVPVEAPP
jgi:hypothetical protein